MKTFPLLLNHDINKNVGYFVIDEKFLPDHWYYEIAPAGRVTYDNSGKMTNFEVLEFSIINISARKLINE